MFINRNALEPVLIVCLFTFGTLLNRRRRRSNASSSSSKYAHYDVESSPGYDSDSDTSEQTSSTLIPPPPPPRASSNIVVVLLRRFFDTFPFLAEIWYWNLTYWIYQLLRACSAVMIADNKAVFQRAQDHAISIFNLERALGFDFELPLQRYVLSEMPNFVPYLANIYYSHICVGICFIIYTYTFLPRATFCRIRRTIALDNAIALIIVTLWRCAPPRMLPEEYGFIDVLHGGLGGKSAGAASVWTHNRFQLTIAAMPSLHFGTSLFLGVCMVRFSPHRPLRLLAPLWPAAMFFTIVTTANHFITDAIIGAMIPLISWRYNNIVLTLKPIEDWIFAPFMRVTVDDETSATAVHKRLVD
jgi:hypothetical protein